jgi:DNA-binding SARP family transcriptional activator
VRFLLLGPLEVAAGETLVPVGAGRRRALLALLLLHANEVLGAERLIDELWGERPTATAAKSLHVYVSQLRKELAPADVVLTRGGGYVIRAGPGELDVLDFERLLEEGRRALDDDRPEVASERLRAALALWRGPALADFVYERFAERHIARLEELRLVAIESRVDADLALGRHAELVGELEGLVADQPLRERLRGQLMLALYRCERQAEALEVFREGRSRLVGDLGLEPGPELRALEAAILAHSPELAAPARRRSARPQAGPPKRRRLRLLPVIVVASAVLLSAAALAAMREDEPEPAAVKAAPPALDISGNAVAGVDPRTGAPRLALPLPGRPTDLAADGDTAWAVTVDTAALVTVDGRTGTITRSVPLALTPGAVAFGEGGVWVADGRRGELVRTAPGYGEVSAPIVFRRGRLPAKTRADATGLAAGAGGVWVTDGSPRLARVDPRTRAVEGIATGMPLNGVAVGAGAVWAISARRASVLRIDPRRRRVTDRIRIVARTGEDAPAPAAVGAGERAVWVLNRNTASVVRIDPAIVGVDAVIPLGPERVPNELIAAGRSAWVAAEDGTLARLDERSTEVRSLTVGESLRQVAAYGARLWVGTAALDQTMPGGGG